MGRAKQEKFWEVRQAKHTQQGQDRELYPFLHLIGEVLHCSTPPPPTTSRPKPKKRMRERKRQKVFFLGVGAADSKNKNDAHISGCQILA
jgi:hypothetical protein